MSGLKRFLQDSANSVSRERLFNHKLFYDLKLAAARCGCHLSIFEPEVDRDSYDIIIDDGDNDRRIQLKTVLASSGTTLWRSKRRFIAPHPRYAQKLHFEPAFGGDGGVLLLIEVDDSTDPPAVRYAFADFLLALSLYRGWLRRASVDSSPSPGRPPLQPNDAALHLLKVIEHGHADNIVEFKRPLFVYPKSPDALLALLGMQNALNVHLPSEAIANAEEYGLRVDKEGSSVPEQDAAQVASTYCQMTEYLALLDEPSLQVFQR